MAPAVLREAPLAQVIPLRQTLLKETPARERPLVPGLEMVRAVMVNGLVAKASRRLLAQARAVREARRAARRGLVVQAAEAVCAQ